MLKLLGVVLSTFFFPYWCYQKDSGTHKVLFLLHISISENIVIKNANFSECKTFEV